MNEDNRYGSGVDKDMFAGDKVSSDKKRYGVIGENDHRPRRTFMLITLLVSSIVAVVIAVSVFSFGRGDTSYQEVLDTSEPEDMAAGVRGFIEGYIDNADSEAGEAVDIGASQDEKYVEAEPALSELVPMEVVVLPQQLIVLCTNNSDIRVNIDMQAVFYDSTDSMMSIENGYLNYLNPGQTNLININCPRNQDYDPVPYARYDISYDVEESSNDDVAYDYFGDSFIISANTGVDGTLLCDIKNPTGRSFENVWIYCIFYNQGEPVGVYQKAISEMGERELVDLDLARGTDYRPVPFDDYRIIIGNTINLQAD